jgi:hypothetical protein
MCRKCLFVFLAGAAVWDAYVHLMLALTNQSIRIWGVTLSQNLNYLFAGGAIVIGALLLYLAYNARCECEVKQM